MEQLGPDLKFVSRREAGKVLAWMRDTIDDAGAISLGDLYWQSELPVLPGDDEIGWTDLVKAFITSKSDGFHMILPQPKLLAK